jgi:hypothetical protein
MYFNIVITTNDLLFVLAMIPLLLVFSVMFKDWYNDKDRYK